MSGEASIKVLFAYHTASRGGVDEFLYTVIKHLHREKFAPSVLVPQSSGIDERYAALGVPVVNLNLPANGYRIGDVLKIARALKPFDVVYGNSICKSTRNVGLAAKLARKPFLWHVYEVLTESHAPLARFLKFADGVAAVSKTTRDSMAPYLTGTVPVVYNPFDTQLFQSGDEQRKAARLALLETYSLSRDASICVTVGRVSDAKGIFLLLQVARRVLDAIPQAIFLVVGDWVCSQEEVRSQMEALGLEGRVVFAGFQNDVLPFLRGADVLLHPSKYESFGRVIAEGLACNLPAVAFNLGGIAEVFEDGKAGYLVPPFDVEAFAQQTVVLLRDESLRRRMGAHGRAQVERQFSIGESVRKIENILEASYPS
jgi:glycosyltransferase involved in cell wall biosynthesis